MSESEEEIYGSFEARVAKLRPGATKELAHQLLRELRRFQRLTEQYEADLAESRAWRAGVEHAWKAAGVIRA